MADLLLSPHCLSQYVPAQLMRRANTTTSLSRALRSEIESGLEACFSRRVIEGLRVTLSARAVLLLKDDNVAKEHKARGNTLLREYTHVHEKAVQLLRGSKRSQTAPVFTLAGMDSLLAAVRAYSLALRFADEARLVAVILANRSACWAALATVRRCARRSPSCWFVCLTHVVLNRRLAKRRTRKSSHRYPTALRCAGRC